MSIHVEEMSSEVSVVEGELPLSAAQIERLVKMVIDRLARQQQNTERAREATRVRTQAAPPSAVHE
jgi:hypothetical protein